jgi:estrone sulfotransferase
MHMIKFVKSIASETLFNLGYQVHRLPSNSERAKRLGLAKIYDDDVFVVSYPRSGNTWVRFLIAILMYPHEEIDLQTIECYVPDIHRDEGRRVINSLPRPRFIKSHRPCYSCYPRFIYIYRDGRDALVSFYHYASKNWGFEGSFSDFLLSRQARRVGHWHEHVSCAVSYAKRHPGRALLIRYEEMLDSPFNCTMQIARFCGITADRFRIENAVKRCEFGELKEMQDTQKFQIKGKIEMFRSGETGQWRDVFSEKDLRIFLAYAGSTLRELGYSLDR